MGRDGRGVKGASESSIEITFMYKGTRCRERIPLKPTAPNLKRAENHRAAILYAIANNSFDYSLTFPNSPNAAKFAVHKGDVEKVERYLEQWLDGERAHLKDSTFNGYRKIVHGQLIPWFGQLTLSSLGRKEVKEKLRDLQVSNKTLANIQSILRKAMDDAVDEELIERNPLSGWCFSKKEEIKHRDAVDPFGKDEQAAILQNLTGQGRNLIQFAFWTGMRTSELVALNWTDIDFVRGVVIVARAMTQHSKKAEVTKTDAGNREVKLLASAMDALSDQKKYTWFTCKEVFQNPQTLERWAGDQPIRKTLWTSALKKGGIRYRYPYQTRHTYASMMLSAGEHPMWVARQMGHADWTMIARVYGKWMPDADRTAGSRAEAIFGSQDTEAISSES